MWYPAAVLLFVLMQTPNYSAEGLKALDGANYAVAVEQFSKAVAADPKDYTAQMQYDLTFFPASEAVAERCTEKSIMYTPLILGGVIANQVKRILAGNTVKPAITMSMKEYQIVFM